MSHKVLVIGDPHFKVNNVEECRIMTKRLIEIAKEHCVNQIICLGDVLDRHETIHVIPLENAIQCLYQLSLIAPLVVLIGNHDRPNNNHYLTADHPFHALKYWNNTKIIDTVEYEIIHGHRFIYVPYVPPGRFEEAILTTHSIDELTSATCIFAHQEFYGVQMGPIKSEIGDKWSIDYPLVVSGHIHEQQILQDNIIYVGTPMQHAFGEDPDKTISIFTFSSDKTFQRIQLDLGIPKKIVIRCNAQESLEYQPVSNSHIKMIIQCSNTEFKSLLKHQRIRDLQRLGVKIQWKSTKEYKPISVDEKISFTQRLMQRLQTMPELKALYLDVIRT